MIPYKTKENPFSGTRYAEVAPLARAILRAIARKTKRQPYIRSAHFQKEKIFFTHFWNHLKQRSIKQQTKRLKYLPCALDLIQYAHQIPVSKRNVDRPRQILHRFTGISPNGVQFFVQIKEDTRTKRKELMSVFPLLN